MHPTDERSCSGGRHRPSRVSAKALAAAAIALACLAASPPRAEARDREFGLLVQQIESSYHARRSHRILIGFAGGFANVVVRVWRPFGVKNFKLALFQDQNLSAGRNDLDFPRVIRAGLSQGWQPLVQVWSRRDGERTYVFAKDSGKYAKFLIATVESDEAVVVQVQVNPDKLARSVERWSNPCHCNGHGGDPEDDSAPSDAFAAVLAQARTGRASAIAGR